MIQVSRNHIRAVLCGMVFAISTMAAENDSSGGAILWQVSLPHGFSGFCSASGRLFTQGQDVSGQLVLALDASSGKELWRTVYEEAWNFGGLFPGTYATPAYSDGRVFFMGCAGAVGALDARDGRLLWKVDVCRDLQAIRPGFGFACTPRIFQGKLFLPLEADGNNGGIMALDASDGSLVWRAEGGEATYVSAEVFTIDDQAILIACMVDATIAYDPSTGRELWQTPDTGQASALIHDGRLVLVNERGVLIIAQATPNGYQELHRTPVLPGDLCWARPVIVDGHLFIRSRHRAACVILWKAEW